MERGAIAGCAASVFSGISFCILEFWFFAQSVPIPVSPTYLNKRASSRKLPSAGNLRPRVVKGASAEGEHSLNAGGHLDGPHQDIQPLRTFVAYLKSDEIWTVYPCVALLFEFARMERPRELQESHSDVLQIGKPLNFVFYIHDSSEVSSAQQYLLGQSAYTTAYTVVFAAAFVSMDL